VPRRRTRSASFAWQLIFVPGRFFSKKLAAHGVVCARPKSPIGHKRRVHGADLSLEQGYEAARLTGIIMLANIRSVLGTLDRIERVVKTPGMVNCTPDFGDTPKVINGFSDLFVQLLGVDKGRGARSAGGMMALPGSDSG
jgi:hypothetical protein